MSDTSDTNIFIKGSPGRKKIYDVDYRQHVKDVKYNLKYYHAHKAEKVNCDRCKKTVTRFSLREHERSKYCMAVNASKKERIIITADEQKLEEEKEQQILELKTEMDLLQKRLDLLYSA